MSFSKLAVIGTAGRREDAGRLTADHYSRMVNAVAKFITHKQVDPKKLYLVSGGAAWADHVPVSLALMGVIPVENLMLYLPARLEYYGYEADDDDKRGKQTASTANYYHGLFSSKVGNDSIKELCEVSKLGATIEVSSGGFHTRNSMVAAHVRIDGAVLAMTFGDPKSDQPAWTIRGFSPETRADIAGLKDGGTADTFNKSKCLKYHARLGSMNDDYIAI